MVERNRVQLVKSKLLTTKSIKLKTLWVSECVQFCIQQCPAIDDETLIAQTLEQFLLADLTDASDPVIPVMIAQKRESFELVGTFVLQLVYLIDISESPYDQWRKLHNKTLDEAEERREPKTFQAKKKRVFKLELTDGYKTVTAMEYSPVPILNTKLSPGMKLQIIGPVRVVNHILLLEPMNVKILGGDVERLLIVNAYENVLLRALNRPTTDTPITDYTEAQLAAENKAPSRQIEAKPMLASKKVESKPLQSLQKQDEEFLASIDFDDLDDEDFDMAEIERIEEEGRKKLENRQPMGNQNQPTRNQNQATSNQHQSTRNANPPSDDDEEFLADIDFDALENQIQVQPRNVSRPVVEKPFASNIAVNYASSSSTSVSSATNGAINSVKVGNSSTSVIGVSQQSTLPASALQPPKVHTITDDLYKFKSTNGDNFATIDQFLALKPADKMKRNFVLKAKLHAIVPNSLKVKSNQWSVRAELSDAYSHKLLSVQIHNEVLEKLSGHSGERMSLMFLESKTRMQVKEEIFDIIQSLQKKIESLSCFMKIESQFNPLSQTSCQVIELLEPSADNAATFRRKVEEEKLAEVVWQPL